MSSIKPSNNPPQPPRPPGPPEHTPGWKVFILLLKILGAVVLAFVIYIGILLGTCMLGGRGFRG